MSQAKRSGGRAIGRDDNRLPTGALVRAKINFGAVPSCGSRAKVRIPAGTTGIIEDSVVKSCVAGMPDFPFVSFERPGGRVICVPTDPSAIAPL